MSTQPMPALAPPATLTGLPGPVWGIDPSTLRVALGVLDPRPWEVEVRWDVLSLPRGTAARRLSLALDVLEPWFREHAAMGGAPVAVSVEQPFGRHVHPSSYLMLGVVLVAVHRAAPRARFWLVQPGRWKRLALGDGCGGASKEQVLVWARGAGYTGHLEDEADAIAIATAAGVEFVSSAGAAIQERTNR